MSLYHSSQNIQYVTPPNGGWLEYKLDSNELDYVWERVNEKESSYESNKPSLAGDIHESKLLEDPDDWFFNNVLSKCCEAYSNLYCNLGNKVPIPEGTYSYYMREWWVNYQKQTEFNPSHTHTGVYSFVIWLKIPIEHEEQNKDIISNMKLRSSFQFSYTDILGRISQFNYDLNKTWEGVMLFFPSQLEHQVYPFYNCDDYRISISGNILCKI